MFVFTTRREVFAGVGDLAASGTSKEESQLQGRTGTSRTKEENQYRITGGKTNGEEQTQGSRKRQNLFAAIVGVKATGRANVINLSRKDLMQRTKTNCKRPTKELRMTGQGPPRITWGTAYAWTSATNLTSGWWTAHLPVWWQMRTSWNSLTLDPRT